MLTKILLILLIGILSHHDFNLSAHAAEADTADPVNPKLSAKAESLIKSAMKVVQEDEGEVSMTSPGHSYAPKTQILFFRRRGTRIEMIATGIFNREKVDAKSGKKELIADLDRDNIIKYPQLGDYAVPMNDPNATSMNSKDGGDFPAPEEDMAKKSDHLPGYLEFGMGVFSGSFLTASSDEANASKISSNYRFGLTHLAYYSSFIPVGLEMDSYQGYFPTATYLTKIVASGENLSFMSFAYRFKPMLKNHLAIMAKVNTISDAFTTNNTDVSVLTTKASGLGFGIKAEYQLISPVWKKEPKDFFIQLQSFFTEFIYYPTITATDQGVSRGTSSTGSSMLQYRIGATGLAWISFIPFFKRWVIQGSYGARAYHLNFSGATVSEVGNPVPLPPNGTSKETEKDYRAFIGIRIDDPVKLILGNDEKKKEK